MKQSTVLAVFGVVALAGAVACVVAEPDRIPTYVTAGVLALAGIALLVAPRFRKGRAVLNPLPKGLAWFATIFGVLVVVLNLVNAVLGTAGLSAWLPFLIVGCWVVYTGTWSLRNQRHRTSSAPANRG